MPCPLDLEAVKAVYRAAIDAVARDDEGPRLWDKARRLRQGAVRRRADAAAPLRYQARARLCHAPCCSLPATTGEDGHYPCCSAACLTRWTVELDRKNEVRQARRLGIPVALLRARKATP